MSRRRYFIPTAIFIIALLASIAPRHTRAQIAQSCLRPPANLVAWYAGDDTSRDQWQSNHGTLQGANFTDGRVGRALLFDGVNDYVATSLDVQPSAMPATTWEAWVRPGRVPHTSHQTLFTNDDGGFDRGIIIAANTHLYSVLTGTGLWNLGINAAQDQWQHIAVVYAPDYIEAYINGNRYRYHSPPSGQTSANKFRIGGNPAFGQYFKGAMDEVSIYNRALSQSEIQAIYSAGSSGKCKPGLARCFAAPVVYGTGVTSIPTGIVNADFDRDGDTDLITSNRALEGVPGSISFFAGDGAGGFAPAVVRFAGTDPEGIAAGDFNSDAKLDLAIANQNKHTISILIGDGAGAFSAPVYFPAGGDGPSDITVADFNADAKPDLVVRNIYDDTFAILFGDGAGSFATPIVYMPGDDALRLAVGDFDRNGKPDIAVTRTDAKEIAVFLNDGDGSLRLPASVATAGRVPVTIEAGDFNSDDMLDLAVTLIDDDYDNPEIATFLGDGTGGFSLNARRTVERHTGTFAIADFNSDNHPDIAYNDPTPNGTSLFVLHGDGTGNFAPPIAHIIGATSYSMTAGDFDRDGKPDLAAGRIYQHGVPVLLNDFCGTKFAPTADTYVKGATPDQNFGSATELQVKRTLNPGSGKGRQAYLRFDTSAVNGTITRATLRVFGNLNAPGANNLNTFIPVAVFPVASVTWSEQGVTWVNKPAPTVPHELTRLTVPDATARWYEFDVTTYVRDERAAGRNTVSLLLRNMLKSETGDFYTRFNSREAATHRPQLVLER